ncbi:MAG: glycerophosphodiester phosphodiesterase, partial [Bacteroidota bacterium]
AYQHVTPSLVQQCKERKMVLIPWTVNDLPTMQRLKDMGVNGIISDYPNLFAALK